MQGLVLAMNPHTRQTISSPALTALLVSKRGIKVPLVNKADTATCPTSKVTLRTPLVSRVAIQTQLVSKAATQIRLVNKMTSTMAAGLCQTQMHLTMTTAIMAPAIMVIATMRTAHIQALLAQQEGQVCKLKGKGLAKASTKALGMAWPVTLMAHSHMKVFKYRRR